MPLQTKDMITVSYRWEVFRSSNNEEWCVLNNTRGQLSHPTY